MKIKLHENILRGKMEGIPAISVNVTEKCKERMKLKGSICSKCYGFRTCKMYLTLGKALDRNSELLEKELPKELIPKINNIFYRFNSFGELINSTHLDNLVKIVKANPLTKFAIWTKEYKICETYFNSIKKPKNLQLIYSGLYINTPLSFDKYKHCDKVFNVYTKDFIKNNKTIINCKKSCFDCHICYTKNKVKVINELLK